MPGATVSWPMKQPTMGLSTRCDSSPTTRAVPSTSVMICGVRMTTMPPTFWSLATVSRAVL